jgi:acetyl/propionyl-CoA carboxylase alpha subunit
MMSDSAGGDQPRPLSVERYRVRVADQETPVEIVERANGLFVRVGEGPEQSLDVISRTDDGEMSVLLDGALIRALIGERDGGRTIVSEGSTIDVSVLDERAARLAAASAAGRPATTDASIRAPMPGLVVAVNVEAGQSVSKGMTLVVLSAMKMQNELTARDDATVKEVLVSAGQTVNQNQVLVTLE